MERLAGARLVVSAREGWYKIRVEEDCRPVQGRLYHLRYSL